MEPGTFNMSWKTLRGEDWYEELFLGPKYVKLAEYIRKIAKNNGEHTLRTVFGPNASYWTMSLSGFSWQNLPPILESDMLARIRKGQPSCVALGVGTSFVVLYSDGNVTFDVAEHYPQLDGIIRNVAESQRRKGMAYIALNPHAAGQYYIAYGDGSASWNLPNHFIQDVTDVSKTLKPIRAAGTTIPGVSAASLAGAAAATGGVGAAGAGFASAGGTSPGGSSTTSNVVHGLGKLWHAYESYENNQQNGSGSNSPFNQSSFFDPSGGGGFSPGGFNGFGGGFDPGSVSSGFDPSSFVSALDPNTLAAGVANLFGN
uniref:Uncharacterized protein n=1 Tax=Mycena chlorophos TaxID=658473 RepID=A0ABQ0LBW0_MYCCL|nr:predicted protein [Mycena chlorophos]